MKNILYTSLVAAAIILSSCSGESNDKKAELEKLKKDQQSINDKIKELETELNKGKTKESASKAAMVQTTPVKSAPFVHFIEVQGRIDSDKNITLSAKASGTITKVYVTEGQSVRKGQVLAQIESDILDRSVAELQTSLDFANNLYAKQAKLWEQKIGTEIQYLQAKNNKESLERRMASLREQIDLAKIVAPFAGVVDEVIIKEGEVAGPGFPAVRIVNPSEFKVNAEITESYITRVKKGDNVIVRLPDLDKTINSKVNNVSRVINQVNRTFMIEVDLPASISKEAKANMIAYINIEDYKNGNAVVVPINVVQHSEEEGDYVFVAENNKAVKRIVKIGETYKNDAEVISGLKAGDQIIVNGYQDLVDQQSIAYNN